MYWIPVTYVLNSQRHEFGVMSGTSQWVEFRKKMITCLGVDTSCTWLAYWLCVDGCIVGDLVYLLGEKDWHLALSRAGDQFDVSGDVELEVVEVNYMVT